MAKSEKRARTTDEFLRAEEDFDPMPASRKTKPGEIRITLVSKVLGRKRAKVDRDGEAQA